MKSPELEKALKLAVEAIGVDKVLSTLEQLSTVPNTRVLTLIANAGVHKIPESLLKGDVYVVSHGNWSTESEDKLNQELKEILGDLARKLCSRNWETVYLIPTGHPVLSAHVKTMVYRLLRINTVDLYYREGSYFHVNIDHRSIGLQSSNEE